MTEHTGRIFVNTERNIAIRTFEIFLAIFADKRAIFSSSVNIENYFVFFLDIFLYFFQESIGKKSIYFASILAKIYNIVHKKKKKIF